MMLSAMDGVPSEQCRRAFDDFPVCCRFVIKPKSLDVSCGMSQHCDVFGTTESAYHKGIRPIIAERLNHARSRPELGANDNFAFGGSLGNRNDGESSSGASACWIYHHVGR